MGTKLAERLSALDNGLTRLCRVGLFISFMVLIAAVMIQVVGRTVVQSSPVWTEELTRFALLYLTAFGAGLALRSGDLVNVDLFSESLPGVGPWILRLFSAICIVIVCVLLLQPSWAYTSIGAMQTSPTLGIRMNFIHASITVLLVFLILFALLRILLMLSGHDKGLPQRENGTVD